MKKPFVSKRLTKVDSPLYFNGIFWVDRNKVNKASLDEVYQPAGNSRSVPQTEFLFELEFVPDAREEQLLRGGLFFKEEVPVWPAYLNPK